MLRAQTEMGGLVTSLVLDKATVRSDASFKVLLQTVTVNKDEVQLGMILTPPLAPA